MAKTASLRHENQLSQSLLQFLLFEIVHAVNSAMMDGDGILPSAIAIHDSGQGHAAVIISKKKKKSSGICQKLILLLPVEGFLLFRLPILFS